MLNGISFNGIAFNKLLFQHIFFLSTKKINKKLLMLITIMKNITNNCMCTVEELYIFHNHSELNYK